MQDELTEQQRITDEVRQEAVQYLNEMRTMSENSVGSFEREEKLVTQVSNLERELKEWKARYARAKSQLRSLRASSAVFSAAVSVVNWSIRANALAKDSSMLALSCSNCGGVGGAMMGAT